MRSFRAFCFVIGILMAAAIVGGCGADGSKPSTSNNSTNVLDLGSSEDDEVKDGSPEAIDQEAKDTRRVKRKISELCTAKSFDRPKAAKSLSDAYDSLFYDSLVKAYGVDNASSQTRIDQVVSWTKRCQRSKKTYLDWVEWYEGAYVTVLPLKL